MAFNFPPERGITRKPGTEPVPLVIRIGDRAILMVRAVFFSTEWIAITVIIGECLTGESSTCLSRREKIPPYSGHGEKLVNRVMRRGYNAATNQFRKGERSKGRN